MTTTTRFPDLTQPYPLTGEQTRFFRENGFIKLKQVLSKETLDHYGREITGQVFHLNPHTRPVAERDTYGKAFIQVGNLWRHSEIVREFCFSPRLARLAADLMGVKGVRLYHDQALYKEAGGGITPWHVDQHYWPLDTINTCTVWVPLQATPMNMGPLAFSVGSHRIKFGRELAISDESEKKIQEHLSLQKLPINDTPFDLGEVSYHYGWTFHHAGENQSGIPRKVMTIIYFEDGCRMHAPRNKSQENDWNSVLPGAKIGEIVDTPLNPVLYRAA